MDIYSYGAPGSKFDNHRNVETLKDYVDCGFNVYFLTGKNAYIGGGWENSNSKQCFINAEKVGIDKVILDDMRIIDLVDLKDALVGNGEGCKFKNTDELDEFVKSCMQEYAHEKNLFGLRICDEPTYPKLHSCGYVYHSIKRVAKQLGLSDFFVHLNMLPLVGDHPITVAGDGVERTIVEEYEYYLDCFLRETGADVLCVDNYPFRPRLSGGIFLLGYFACFQILRRVCDKHGAKMAFVLQSFEMIHKTKPEATAGYRRITTINEMMLQTNAALGFGVNEFSFYTYATMGTSETSAYRSADGSSFITENGTKTRIYEFGKTAIAHVKQVEQFMGGYVFKGAKLLLDGNVNPECKGLYLGGAEFTTLGGTRKGAEFDNSYNFESIEKLEIDSDILLATEFSAKSGNAVMIENVLDIVYKCDLAPMKVNVKFKSAKSVKVLHRGEIKTVELKDGIYTTELNVGEADYLILE